MNTESPRRGRGSAQGDAVPAFIGLAQSENLGDIVRLAVAPDTRASRSPRSSACRGLLVVLTVGAVLSSGTSRANADASDATSELRLLGHCRGCVLGPASHVRRNLMGIDFRNAVVTGVDFTGSNLSVAQFDGARLIDVVFSGAQMKGASFSNAHLTGVRFDGADLTGATFEGAAMGGADLEPAILCNTQMSDEDLDNSDCRR